MLRFYDWVSDHQNERSALKFTTEPNKLAYDIRPNSLDEVFLGCKHFFLIVCVILFYVHFCFLGCGFDLKLCFYCR